MEKINALAEQYIYARDHNEFEEFGEETKYREIATRNRQWLHGNILNFEKLTHYTDAEFAQKFFDMYDYMEGSKQSHSRTRGIFFKATERRIAIRKTFENIISFIINADDKDSILQTLMRDSAFNIKGLGRSTLAQLIYAQHEDTPYVNDRTETFFKDIGSPLSNDLVIRQHEINEFYANVAASHPKMDYDDINHMFWYTQEVTSGINFMKNHYAATYDIKTPTARKTRSKPTKLNDYESILAHLRAVHDAAQSQKEE